MKSKYQTLLDIIKYVRNESDEPIAELLMMGFTPSQLINEFHFNIDEVKKCSVFHEIEEALGENIDETEYPFILDNYSLFDAALISRFELSKEDLAIIKKTDVYTEMKDSFNEEKIEALTEVTNSVLDKFESEINYTLSNIPEKDSVLNDFFESLYKQEQLYGVEITLSPADIKDSKHLDCLWYGGGEIGRIKYKDYAIVIGAYGDIRLGGMIDGKEFDYKDKDNSDMAYHEFGSLLDDKKLYELLDSNDGNNYLTFENNNWFEVNLISPDGEIIDLFGMDNVLDNNLLDCFRDVSVYFEYVDMEIENNKNKEVSEKKYFEVYVNLGSIENGGYFIYVEGFENADEVAKGIDIEDGCIDFIAEIDKCQYYERKGKDMPVVSWEDIQNKYPLSREEMDEETEKAFVEDCFNIYEKEGFSKKFWTPYDDLKNKIGERFEVVGRCSEDLRHLSCLPLWIIRFNDGIESCVHPEEIIPSEMRVNGCPFYNNVKSSIDGLITKATDRTTSSTNAREHAHVGPEF